MQALKARILGQQAMGESLLVFEKEVVMSVQWKLIW
jgi:hypothetical protein